MRIPAETNTIIIVPPFAGIDRPSLGAHVLQASAASHGHSVSVVYANLLFAKAIGEENYQTIIGAPPLALLGERCLAPFAYQHRFIDDTERRRAFDQAASQLHSPTPLTFDVIEDAIRGLSEFLHSILAEFNGVVGFSSIFEQINATVILSRTIFSINENICQIVGGANCEAEMAFGQATLLPHVSHIFSGESERTFVAFLSNPKSFSGRKIITGLPNNDLNSLPCPNFFDFLEQFHTIFGTSDFISDENIRLPYECSRGCWWGAKHHCTFCGLNGQGMNFREKSPEKVINELEYLYRNSGIGRIFMTDNIMPYKYFDTLLPKLAQSEVKFDIFFEQKANIDLNKILSLSAAGVRSIQPGIESLISETLSLMKKGIKASRNIRLLRYCRSAGIEVAWNVLYGFPGERAEWYERFATIIPMLAHLYPPSGLCDLSLDRFSPYFNNPRDFGINNLRPHASYSSAILEEVDLNNVAYHFVGDINNCLQKNSEEYKSLATNIAKWRKYWLSDKCSPMLHLTTYEDRFLLIDTRPVSSEAPVIQMLEKEQASVCVTDQFKMTPLVEWGLANRYSVYMDGKFVPLATAEPSLLASFEASALHNTAGVPSPDATLSGRAT